MCSVCYELLYERAGYYVLAFANNPYLSVTLFMSVQQVVLVRNLQRIRGTFVYLWDLTC